MRSVIFAFGMCSLFVSPAACSNTLDVGTESSQDEELAASDGAETSAPPGEASAGDDGVATAPGGDGADHGGDPPDVPDPNGPHPLDEEPGVSCDGALTPAGKALLASTKPAGFPNQLYTGYALPNGVTLGPMIATLYIRECSSTLGGCTAWTETPHAPMPSSSKIVFPRPDFRTGKLGASFGNNGTTTLLFRSDEVATVPAGGGQTCTHSFAANGWTSATSEKFTVRGYSTCSNDGSGPSDFALTVTDTCTKAVKVADVSRSDFGEGAYVAKQVAVVLDARY